MTENQLNFFDNQDTVNIDIDDLYNKIIRQIDDFRSHFNGLTPQLSQSISQEDIDKLFSSANIYTPQFQESRCSTFYRMIGFPVIDKEDNIYSPGFDPVVNRNHDLLKNHIHIANNINNKIKNILNQKELLSKNNLSSLTKQDINSTALSIASMFVRQFDKQIPDPSDPFSGDPQKFTIKNRDDIKNKFYQDISSQITVNLTQSIHILKPFIVNPLFDFTVVPARNRISVPFPADLSETRLVSGQTQVFVKRPYIERVITSRFSNKNVFNDSEISKDLGATVDTILQTIKDNSSIDDSEIQELSSNVLADMKGKEGPGQLFIFNRYLKVIRALIDELVYNIHLISKNKKTINWQPVPDLNTGLEGNITSININTADTPTRNKEIEQNILLLQNKKIQYNLQLDIGLNAPDQTGFTFSNIDDIVMGDFKNTSSFFDTQLSSLNNKRNKLVSQNNDAIRKIEIITGEFSGLGLLDIFAIQATLWVIKPEALVGLVDDRVYQRIQNNNSMKDTVSVIGRSSPTASLQEFETKLSEVYKLIQKLFDGEMQ